MSFFGIKGALFAFFFKTTRRICAKFLSRFRRKYAPFPSRKCLTR